MPNDNQDWFGPGVAGIGTASLLADAGHEIPTALLPSLVTSTLHGPAAALGLIEGISDGLAGVARLAGGGLADDPSRRRAVAVGGYVSTAALAAATGAATSVWQVGLLRAGAWTARGLRVPARNALLADVVPSSAYGRAYGFERMMDNLGAIIGPLLALVLVAAVGVRWAIGLSVIPGMLAAGAIVYAIRKTRVRVERSPAPVVVSGDRVHLEQVILNLLMNAMEAMAEVPEEERKVVVRTGTTDAKAHVAVEDSGIGFCAEAAQRLFEPFYTTKAAGMGMGLSVARSIVEAHGGTIWATNNGTRGATFHFALPRADERA